MPEALEVASSDAMDWAEPEASRAPASADGWLPCCSEQEGLWLLEQTNDIGSANNLPFVVDLRGKPDIRALREAFDALVERHPALRTVFAIRNGRLRRRECDGMDLARVKLELCTVTGDLEAALRTLSSTPIDVLERPPYRVVLLSDPPERHTLAFVFHHCAIDGTSVDILLRDMAALYDVEVGQRPASLTELTGSYADYVAGEEETIQQLADIARAHWERRLPAVATSLRLPMSGTSSGTAASVDVLVGAELTGALRELARSCGSSLFTTLLAGLQLLQYRYASGGDEGVATAVAMDTRPRRMAPHVGMFANEAPVLTSIADDQGFAALVEHVQSEARKLFRLRRFPYTEALRRYGGSGAGGETTAQVGITYFRAAKPLTMSELALRARGLVSSHGARRPLMVWVFDEGDRLRIRFDHDENVLAPEIASGLAHHFVTLLEAAVANPACPVSALPFMGGDERRRVLVEWNGPGAPARPGTVHALVEAQTRRSPYATALRFEGHELTYRDLDERANQLAHRLRALGVRQDTSVAICLERSLELVVGLLGILKAGGAYVPMDPDYPIERLRFMADDAGASVLVTQESLRERVSAARAPLLVIDKEAESVTDEPKVAPAESAGSEHLAYIIYTSGSTGVPKGVAMPHGPLWNLLTWQRDAFVRVGPVTTLQFTSVSFDVAFQEIFSTLTTGGCLVLISGELRQDLERLAEFIAPAGIGRIFMPFLALAELARHINALEPASTPLEVITAGERLEITPAIRRLWARHPTWTLENQYGPSESHVVTSHRLSGGADRWPQLPPIGRPIAGAKIYVLDPRSQPVPVGVPGELHIGGAMLARGYLDRPKLNAERFVPDPFGPAGSRMYRTGDIARWRADGTVEFIARIDHQVKIRGHRVEPGEIEVALTEHPGVRDAAVIATEDKSGKKRLVAYVVSAGEQRVTAADLRAFVGTTLPEFMVPSAFVTLDAMPLTPNGKLDRGGLPEPELAAQLKTDYVAPRTPIEETVADVWAAVLGVPLVGAHDNFFELGGHSLLAGEVVARLRDSLDRELSLRMIFAGPTVAELAHTAEKAPTISDGTDRIPRVARRPLSSARVQE